jgi:glycosyltransferase involved in cell wall biosynthesis
MRIVIATPNLPWPRTDGGKVAQLRTLEALQNDFQFTVVVPVRGTEQLQQAHEFSSTYDRIKVVPVDISPAGSFPKQIRQIRDSRFFKLLKPLRQIKSWGLGFKSKSQKHSTFVEETPYYPFSCLNSIYINAVGAEVAKGCDLFQAELLEMSSLCGIVPKGIPKLFIHHQLHFVYSNRIRSLSSSPSHYLTYLVERMLREETAFLSSFDHVIVFSRTDAEALEAIAPNLNVSVSPFPCPEDPIDRPSDFTSASSELVLVASEYAPNVIGFRWFMSQVWPLIKKSKPMASISVIGRWSDAARLTVPNYEQVNFRGFVENLSQELRGKVMIVPLQVGSGIRTKILASWAAGCPVVTTSIGVEGLPGEHGKDFMVGDAPASFSRCCIELTENIDLRKRLIESGFDNIQKDFTLEAVKRRRTEIYRQVASGSRLENKNVG